MDQDAATLVEEVLRKEVEEIEAEEAGWTEVAPTQETSPTPPEEPKKESESHTQWAIAGNDRFMPVGSTTQSLPPGIYECFAASTTWGVERLNIASDGIYTLPDMATETVLNEVKKFWGSEQKYRAHKLLYKRGIILYGPPGGGKTVTVKLLMNELVKQGGIVIVAQNIALCIMVLKAVRRIEPARNLIVVLEDIDEIVNYNGESAVLSLLDGENNIDNVLHLATTNYPERLGARIINRPSRFDRRVEVGMPGADARKAYLVQATGNGLDQEALDKWVTDTNDMSIAHLRELVAAVYCLDQPYDDVIKRLQDMAVQVKGEEEFKRNRVGFRGGLPKPFPTQNVGFQVKN